MEGAVPDLHDTEFEPSDEYGHGLMEE